MCVASAFRAVIPLPFGCVLLLIDSTAMALGECVGVFPEGTSHTEPHMIPLKDGMSWAALEYILYLNGTEENGGPKKGKKCVILPVSLAYVDKSKYRSKLAAK